ncbi:neuropeptide F receptor-like [Penaeus japonicus]|uniref:neuropeptide F receptor-like n=1 Tax=Penaeus japonicus TaxID=27405 RepID=UPI001C70E7D0|nr:neuropeptide F receptor-like [Penaeus japonicus]
MDNSDLHQIPDKFLGQIIHNLQSFPNETVNFADPQLRKSLTNIYPVFLVMYGLLVVLGTVGNVAMITYILRRRLYRDPTCAFIMNIGVCNVIMSVLLLPLSLAILLIQNWIFGSFLCYFVPMLQNLRQDEKPLSELQLQDNLLLHRPHLAHKCYEGYPREDGIT